MEQYEIFTEDFKREFNESKYHYSDEFLFAQIQQLREEVETLKRQLENDGR